jgi:hypothetical protein
LAKTGNRSITLTQQHSKTPGPESYNFRNSKHKNQQIPPQINTTKSNSVRFHGIRFPGKQFSFGKKKKKKRFPRQKATAAKEALEFRTLETRERKSVRNRPRESRCKKEAQRMLRAEKLGLNLRVSSSPLKRDVH